MNPGYSCVTFRPPPYAFRNSIAIVRLASVAGRSLSYFNEPRLDFCSPSFNSGHRLRSVMSQLEVQ
jgi:hypothetical protein